jgi:hypothetical protein
MHSLLSRSTQRLLVGAASVAVAVTALTAARPIARATGVTFSYRVSSSSTDKKQREMKNMFSTVRMQDGNVRMDYVEGTNPMGQKNGYMIVQGDAGKFVLVDPKEKKAMIMSADAMGSGFGAMLNNPMIKLTVSNTSFRFKDMGAGETILGYRTRKVRTWYSSTVEMKMMMMNQKTVSNDSSDQWIADVDFDPRTMETWAKSFASGVKSTNPELARELASYAREYGRTGIALKTITWSTQTDRKGKVTADTLVMEITDLKSGALDKSLFEIPVGYEVTDMSKMMSEVTASMDSANAESAKGEKDAKKEEKPSAKDAIKAGLGGMFKKKPPM